MTIKPILTVFLIAALSVTTVCAQDKSDKALELAKRWQDKSGSVIRGPDGRVLFMYGESQPRIVCGLFLICDIAMEPGEFIETVTIGDRVRWELSPARVGEQGPHAVDHILIKPEEANLRTNLFVATNRRAYMIELVSTEKESMGQVGFRYGQDSWTHRTAPATVTQSSQSGVSVNKSAQRSDMDILPKPVAQEPAASGIQLVTVDPTPVGEDVIAKALNFNYRVHGDKVTWKPIRVYDDGRKTYIDFNKATVSAQELPALVVNDAGSIDAMINFRYDYHHARLIVDGLFDSASLILGVGRKQSRVRIARAGA